MTSPFSYTSLTVSVEALKHSIAYKLMFIVGKDPAIARMAGTEVIIGV